MHEKKKNRWQQSKSNQNIIINQIQLSYAIKCTRKKNVFTNSALNSWWLFNTQYKILNARSFTVCCVCQCQRTWEEQKKNSFFWLPVFENSSPELICSQMIKFDNWLLVQTNKIEIKMSLCFFDNNKMWSWNWTNVHICIHD